MNINISNFEASDEYRRIIHTLIPGGAHTYSKGDDQFPIRAPAAIDRGKGAYVWDIDGNKFLDGLMGLTAVGLGHAYDSVTNRVVQEIQKGTNFSRPSVLEREMAEKFLVIVPQHDMIKFAKNGSTVTTAAVKLARAYTGREMVAFPYDHPFYSYDDWFIGSTKCSRGVPEAMKAQSTTFKADDLDSLQEMFDQHSGKIACVISEPEKYNVLDKDYLQKAIELTHKNGAIYIVDEMITGYKTSFPGSIAKFDVTPDLTTWGKGIANGFSFTCLTGKKEIMELGGIQKSGEEKVFLASTTHGGETVGIAAALATLEEYKQHDVVRYNQKIGEQFILTTKKLLQKYELESYINQVGFNWSPSLNFKNAKKEPCMGMRTLFNQEMVRRGVLFQGIFSPSYSHGQTELDHIEWAIEKSLEIYLKGLEDGYERHLQGEPIQPVFRKFV